MKVKWTTITEDESTWPPEGKSFLVEVAPGDVRERVRRGRDFISADMSVMLLRVFRGMQWRPMPKPPKKKKSPWKSIYTLPKKRNYAVFVRMHRMGGGVMVGTLDANQDLVNHPAWTEWMEIPE